MPKNHSKNSGFTLLETIISLAIFTIVALAIYFSYTSILRVVGGSSSHLTTLAIIQNEIEGIRNMAYDDIGTVGGAPAGLLPAEKTVTMGDTPYIVKTTIRSIDDPFDGTIGGTPNDLAPADYKLVEIEVSCEMCIDIIPAKMTTTVGPQNLESATRNGALFINVFDASGQPISNADIHVSNVLVTPNISINDVSNINGVLQLVDIATSSFGYSVSVTKSGYTSDRTYPPGDPANPNPIQPHATVARQQVTSLSLVIDRFSTLNLNTADLFCNPVGNIDFLQTGTRLIGRDPDILEYSRTLATNSSGNYTNSALKWDTFNFQNLDTTYEIAGMFSLTPLVINPNTTYNLTWLMETKTPLSALVTVQNQSGQFVNDAAVTLSRTGFSSTKLSGQKFINFTNWSGGQYTEKSDLLATASPAGSLVVDQIDGKYATSSLEWLVSTTTDFGTSDTVFSALEWSPTVQPPSTGIDSLKIQIATNNDNTTWNFIGPDGTAGSFYTTSGATINASHNGNRYLRYKVYLITQDEETTPRLDDLTINFHSACIPDGQAFFSGLTSGTYSIKIEKTGYQTLDITGFSVTGNWQEYRATITP